MQDGDDDNGDNKLMVSGRGAVAIGAVVVITMRRQAYAVATDWMRE
jgi:hypothetical protein